jgi:hypothetical protein
MLGCGHHESAGDFDADSPDTHAALTAARAFRDHSQAFVNLSIYEQRIHRVMEKALTQLQELQAARKAEEQARLEEAIKLQKLHQMQGEPYDPQADGFVYSTTELDRESTRRALRKTAQLADNVGFDPARFRSLTQLLANSH